MTASREQQPKTTQHPGRRALLAGALGGVGAWVAGTISGQTKVRAGTDGDVVLGSANSSYSLTSITNQVAGDVFRATCPGGGIGLHGISNSYVGVYGESSSHTAVLGMSAGTAAQSAQAVLGQSTGDSTGVVGTSTSSWTPPKPKTGVYGFADQDWQSRGVWGYSSQGQGVRGATAKGVGVYGKANRNGYALRAYGRIKADQVSGVATIPAGSTGVTVSPGVNVTAGAFVLLTPQSRLYGRDLWYTTQPSADTFRIRINATRSNPTRVAWLLLG